MKVKYILFISTLFLLFSCNRDARHPVPSFQFDINVNLNLPTYQALQSVGGWAYVNGAGSKGLVVYRRSVAEFVAFDRHSPADIEGTCETPLEVDTDNFLILNDPCSNARFSLFDGSIIQGDVDFGLRSYFTAFDQNFSLRIYN